MPNLDQQTYDDLIVEAKTLNDHIIEWREQFSDRTAESNAVSDAKLATLDVIRGLAEAKSQHKLRREKQIDEALARVANGTSTVHDASLLRSAIK